MTENAKMHLFSLSAIATRGDAIKINKQASMVFFAIAASHAILSALMHMPPFAETIFYGGAGLLVFHCQNRIAAVSLLAYPIANIFIVLTPKGGAVFTERNIIIFALSLIALWPALRAIEATFRLRGKYALEEQSDLT